MQSVSPIFLIGFMGAGKTTVGRRLAAVLGYDFFDLDEMIEERTGKSVREIFAELGEAEFRRIEREVIQSCRGLQRAVIALGGGAYISEENRAILRDIGRTVWLDCPLEVCLARIAGDPARPLLGGEEQMRELLEKRRPFYALADDTIRTGARSAEEIAGAIRELLGRRA